MPAEVPGEAGGSGQERALTSPSQQETRPAVARAAAGGGCCLSAAKAKGAGAGSLCAHPTAPLSGVWVLPRRRLAWSWWGGWFPSLSAR